jgi:carboxypeptidase C (cathepsin A)
MKDDGSLPPAPHVLEDNAASWLEHVDLVFIDPPETGYSIAGSDQARDAMLCVDGDIDVLVDVIRNWLTRHGRWGSALHLAGESYGALRSAAAAERLLDAGIALSGLILISPLLDEQTLAFGLGNDLPHAIFLPAMAGVARYHGRVSPALAASAADARARATEFVQDTYAGALFAGNRLSGEQRRSVARGVSELTGLALDVVLQNDLRITDEVFLAELLRDKGRIVGRMDARCTAPSAARKAARLEFDPSIDSFYAPFSAAIRLHLMDEIGLPADDTYRVYAAELEHEWRYHRDGAPGHRFASAGAELSRALRRNPGLRVLVASGLYDLTTPYSAVNWSLAHLDLDRDAWRSRLTQRFYDAGHMFYTRFGELAKLSTDFERWLQAGDDEEGADRGP